ncbi:hypothetical protein TgHK011_001156 [Trichoderma gracile]|nr:hypothetical protein TgHK011_001156 [Trichoderma gracile]
MKSYNISQNPAILSGSCKVSFFSLVDPPLHRCTCLANDGAPWASQQKQEAGTTRSGTWRPYKGTCY